MNCGNYFPFNWLSTKNTVSAEERSNLSLWKHSHQRHLGKTNCLKFKFKKQAERYPTALQKGLAELFMFEAGFSLMFAENNIDKDDISYVCGHCFLCSKQRILL
jgi:hypothetical protein